MRTKNNLWTHTYDNDAVCKQHASREILLINNREILYYIIISLLDTLIIIMIIFLCLPHHPIISPV